jgi:large subunit ribosomal protein L35Ae
MAQLIQGTIVNYHVGIRTQMSKECLIQFVKTDSVSEAGKLIGRKVVWKEGNSKIVGKIVGLHGKKGIVRARFRKGVPGHALGTNVEIIGARAT